MANTWTIPLSRLWQRSSGHKLAVINKRWQYHAKHSGISPLADGLGLAIPHRWHYLPLVLAVLLYGRQFRDANSTKRQAERLVWFCQMFRLDALFFLAGDFELELIQQLRRTTDLKLCAVFHMPTARLSSLTREFAAPMLDGAVTMSRDLIPIVSPLINPGGHVDFIHHGIDSDYFHPGMVNREKIVLCVGNHGRDFELLNRIAEHFEKQNHPYQLLFIGRSFNRANHALHPRIECIERLSDRELRGFYQRATLLLMPLTATTANNSILEALACGLPIVVSDLPGARDYLTEECARFCEPGDPVSHVQAINHLLHTSQWELSSRAARRLGEQYGWSVVRGRFYAFLKKLMD